MDLDAPLRSERAGTGPSPVQVPHQRLRTLARLSASPWFHALLFLGVSLVVLPRRPELLFNGLDGDYMRILVRDQWAWMPVGTSLGINPMQGISTGFWETNFNLIPVFLAQHLALGRVEPVATFALFAVEFFLATYLWARLFRLSGAVALLAAWTVPFLAFPLLPQYLHNAFYHMIPFAVDLQLAAGALLAGLEALPRVRGARRVAVAAVVVVSPCYVLTTDPILSVMIVPVMAIGSIAILAIAPGWRDRFVQTGVLAATAIALVAGGFLAYAYGIVSYTAVRFFSFELEYLQGFGRNVA